MSGNGEPRVALIGSLGPIVRAIPVIEALTGQEVTVIGGLAVIIRLGRAYRATTDLDNVHRRGSHDEALLNVLLRQPGVSAADQVGVTVDTPLGAVKVDILEVADHELASLPADPTGRLHVMSHAWAAASATRVLLHTRSPAGDDFEISSRVAEPGPLIAMKLQSVEDRPRDKAATDLWDIVQLITDVSTRDAASDQLRNCDPQLAADALLHANRWFTKEAGVTERRMNLVAPVTRAQLAVTADLLTYSLSHPD